ncbi:hypothetical protein IE53DRAFT_220375 [Violaceomyces palustris]|uniref:Uncharacterized protein n=1 Tax=Violaceomyces palustris TaxID=1673888 RepID=A0ACD0NQA5_9BASI|nr:hypothetical protein IE53DRAFT_220375 [Violaceomyces palustris]
MQIQVGGCCFFFFNLTFLGMLFCMQDVERFLIIDRICSPHPTHNFWTVAHFLFLGLFTLFSLSILPFPWPSRSALASIKQNQVNSNDTISNTLAIRGNPIISSLYSSLFRLHLSDLSAARLLAFYDNLCGRGAKHPLKQQPCAFLPTTTRMQQHLAWVRSSF